MGGKRSHSPQENFNVPSIDASLDERMRSLVRAPGTRRVRKDCPSAGRNAAFPARGAPPASPALAAAGCQPLRRSRLRAIGRPGDQPCRLARPWAGGRHLHVHTAHRQQRPQRCHRRHPERHHPRGLPVRGCDHHRRLVQRGGRRGRLRAGQHPVQHQPDGHHSRAPALGRGVDQHRHRQRRHVRPQHQQQREQHAGHHGHPGRGPRCGGNAFGGQRGGGRGVQLRAAGGQQRPR